MPTVKLDKEAISVRGRGGEFNRCDVVPYAELCNSRRKTHSTVIVFYVDSTGGADGGPR